MGKLEKIDAVFADMDKPQHPGAALLVIDHDQVVYRKCYGLADFETQRPITADSSFYLGSIFKAFTAMAIMLLVEDERLSYDDRLPAFFPQFPSWGTAISVRHLLHHTSGLPEYVPLFSSSQGAFEWAREINGLTNEAVLERALDLTGPEFPVGTRYAYSGMGYVLLAMIVAIVLALGGDGLRHVAHGGGCVAYNNYIIRLLDSQRAILVLTNHLGVPGPRIRAHQVAAILFSDRETPVG